LHIHPSKDREKPLMPAKSTTIQRIEAKGLEIQQGGAFDHGQRFCFSTELEKAIVASLESWRNDGNVRRLYANDEPPWTGRTCRGGIDDSQRSHPASARMSQLSQ
jgi:hypothetical protein